MTPAAPATPGARSTINSFPQGTEFGTYGSYLRDLIVRITEIQKIAHKNLIRAKSRSKETIRQEN